MNTVSDWPQSGAKRTDPGQIASTSLTVSRVESTKNNCSFDTNLHRLDVLKLRPPCLDTFLILTRMRGIGSILSGILLGLIWLTVVAASRKNQFHNHRPNNHKQRQSNKHHKGQLHKKAPHKDARKDPPKHRNHPLNNPLPIYNQHGIEDFNLALAVFNLNIMGIHQYNPNPPN